ncbi:hypothetical protein TWF970_008013 [Orbilia oligospora]|uniref:Rieske domain-containing protein n=1 Tax=Orbilia oligospora TaxID=2813651 RepID=A0A7C8V4G7_ORBOL|nr:hypothetical protein TWF970_008013 [Orbilia oligospora]
MPANGTSTNPGLSFTSGHNDPVWVRSNPYTSWPRFKKLSEDLETHTVIAGAGVAGISTAYELVKKGVQVVLLEAREVTSGESGRSNGVLGDWLGMKWQDIIKSDKDDLSKEIEAYSNAAGPTRAAEALDEVRASDSKTFKVTDCATLHPTKYLHGILRYLSDNHSDLFSCYTHTRVKAYKGDGNGVSIEIDGRSCSIKAKNFVMAMNVPIRSRTYIMANAYYRTYHIANTIPKTEALEHIVTGLTSILGFTASVASHPDPNLVYLIVTGGAKILSDQITGIMNTWENVYDASRKPKSKLLDQEIEKVHLEELIAKSREDRYAVIDIEELPPCTGAVISKDKTQHGMPLAIYKDEEGKTRQFTGLCTHAYGVLMWNPTEKTFDCPLHGSRFDSRTGRCVFGPANAGLKPNDNAAREAAALSVEI